MSLLDKLCQWISSRQSGANVVTMVFSDERGVDLRKGEGKSEERIRFAWSDIAAVYAFKVDCYTVDRICIRIEVIDLRHRCNTLLHFFLPIRLRQARCQS